MNKNIDFDVTKKLLEDKKSELMARKERLTQEDPFGDPERLNNNAAVDADAAEQFGHETVTAMLDEIDRKLHEIDRAVERLLAGSYGVCAACQSQIGAERLKIEPTAEYCVECESKKTSN